MKNHFSLTNFCSAKLFIAIAFCFCFLKGEAQNLVPNPSFEEYVDCPTTLFDLEFIDWDAFRGTPDYYNNCSPIVGFSNPCGYQIAHSGNAYAGFVTEVTFEPYWREHLGVSLITPLQIGQTYYVSFFVSKGFKQPAHHLASNNIGVLFSTVLYDDTLNPSPEMNFAHLYEDSIITDTTNWIHLHWMFTADSAYQYLIIGNFFDDAHTDTIMTNPFSHDAVYYVDDVCVSTDSLSCFTSDNVHEVAPTNFSISPNPATTSFEITYTLTHPFTLTITNTIGIIAKQLTLSPNSGSTIIPVDDLPAGMYLVTLLEGDKRISKKLIICR